MIFDLISFFAGFSLCIVISVFICLIYGKNEYNRGCAKTGTDKKVLEEQLKIKTETFNEKLNDRENRILAYEEKMNSQNNKIMELEKDVSILKTRLFEQEKQNDEKIKLLDGTKEKLTEQFKILANEIFEKKSKIFSDQSSVNLEQLLKPFKEQITSFKHQVTETHEKDLQGRAALGQQIKELKDLNRLMSDEAINLANALKGQVKTQGSWGEMILEKVLEKSGLEKGREYEIQVSLNAPEGEKRYQPDVIVRLPENRDIVIDSKLSLISYERYCNAANEKEREEALRGHSLSIKNHIKDLSLKNYQDLRGIRTLDFVFMFIPIEGAFALSVQNNDNFFTEAFRKNIIIVSPSTLLATLRTIENMWRYEHQNQNALEIARKAGRLYDKFVSFVKDLEKLGDQINSTRKSYDSAVNKLSEGRGNLISTSKSLLELGVKANKDLPASFSEK